MYYSDKIIRSDYIYIKGLAVPIVMYERTDDKGIFYYTEIGGTLWIYSDIYEQAAVLYEMAKDHIAEYIRY